MEETTPITITNTPQAIFVRETNWLGDALMTTPALRALRQKYPSAKIHIVVKPFLKEVFLNNPCVDMVMEYNYRRGAGRIIDFMKMVLRLRKHNYTEAVLFQNAFEAALMARLAHIPYRLGYACQKRSFLLTEAVRVPARRNQHQVYDYLNLVTCMDAKIDSPMLEIFPGKENRDEARDILNLLGAVKEDMIIGLAPGASYGSSKRWPLESYIKLSNKLATESGAFIIVFGGSEETDQGLKISDFVGDRSVNVAGKISILTAAALMNKCSFLVTNDSGAMHLGAASGTRVMAIFGPTNITETGPFGKNHMVIQEPTDCAPCLYRECPVDHRCMEKITVQKVYETLINRIKNTDRSI